ncbi:hypothetical protein E4U19_006472 [Claviceps sp. Clav32 group G5]|nr:hypothetical protein E4U40_006744 [Claviceps sp. LM458 group G5]KAG6020301.1 hypothetical protein E4U19_006472 [Claviceps sp. Clav32 group G5]
MHLHAKISGPVEAIMEKLSLVDKSRTVCPMDGETRFIYYSRNSNDEPVPVSSSIASTGYYDPRILSNST